MRSLVSVVFVAACWSSSKPAPAPVIAQPKVAAPPAGYAKTIADPLGFLPIDGTFVVRVDMDRIRRGALWAKYGPILATQIESASAECAHAYDSVRTFTVGMQELSTLRGVAVLRGVVRDQMVPC